MKTFALQRHFAHIIVLLVGLALTACGQKEVAVPGVVGKTPVVARSELEGLGLRVIESPRVAVGQAPGLVIDQDPKAGTKVAAEGTVTLIVAAGERSLNVPSVVRLPFERARAQLEALGLLVKRKEERRATLEFRPDEVVSQNPAPASAVAAGSVIELEIAGPSVAVPDVKGKGLQEATEVMAAAKLLVAVGENQDDPRRPVASTTPAAKEVVLEGTRVILQLQAEQLVPVPNLVGLMFEAAKADLESKRLRAVKKDPPRAVRDFKGGQVISQNPPANITVPAGAAVEVEIALDLPYGPDQCLQGFVWREAFPGDHVCVTGQTRSEAAADNSQAAARRSPTGGPYGPDTCLQGYVWRDANPTDHVCVTPDIRAQAAYDNSQAQLRRVLP